MMGRDGQAHRINLWDQTDASPLGLTQKPGQQALIAKYLQNFLINDPPLTGSQRHGESRPNSALEFKSAIEHPALPPASLLSCHQVLPLGSGRCEIIIHESAYGIY
jgi:hypothetical protein